MLGALEVFVVAVAILMWYRQLRIDKDVNNGDPDAPDCVQLIDPSLIREEDYADCESSGGDESEGSAHVPDISDAEIQDYVDSLGLGAVADDDALHKGLGIQKFGRGKRISKQGRYIMAMTELLHHGSNADSECSESDTPQYL